MTYQRGRSDYLAIANEAADPATAPVEVSEAQYEEMLGVVPPIYVPGGFLVGEALTGHESGTVYAHYAMRGGRYFARYAVLGRQETYIPADFAPADAVQVDVEPPELSDFNSVMSRHHY